MSGFSRPIYLTIACGLHALVLWGLQMGSPAFISSEEGAPGEAVEVGLVESASEPAAQPPTPAPPEPTPPEPTPPDPTPPEPVAPPDAMTEPAPDTPKPVAPRPPTKPAPPRQAKTTGSTARNTGPPAQAAPTGAGEGTTGAGTGRVTAGDQGHATWRNRVKPAYPAAAQAAKQTGRVLVIVNVNALGQATGARVSSSSGIPSLDQAALNAARASSYKPKQIAGIPLPDTITVPYTFQLNGN